MVIINQKAYNSVDRVNEMDKSLTQKMRKLTAKGKASGKVLPVSEAFKLFPVDNEAHNGKIEYWKQGDQKQ